MIPIGSEAANAAISFTSMTASAVVIKVETSKGQFQGLGFSSFGRYGHGGLLKERFIPRLLNAHPEEFVDGATGEYSMSRFWDILMQNEKEGGHGERSGAVGVLESAMWDALAKSRDLPLWALLERDIGHLNDEATPAGQTVVYGSGGHYHSGKTDLTSVADETRITLDAGYAWFKLKVGGSSEAIDKARIETAIEASGNPNLIAVDLNCAFGNINTGISPQDIDNFFPRWVEEPVDPLDYRGLATAAEALKCPIATGENIFSAADVKNLLFYGGLRPGRDILQMDIVLSYGLTEFIRMINVAEGMGWTRRDFIPHAGHQFALHVSAGLGLGGHETATVMGGPFSGVSDDTRIDKGIAYLSDLPGVGIENKPALYRLFDGLLD